MKTLRVKVSETDFQKYNLGNEEIKFTDLVELINQEFAKKALLECNEIAEQTGLSGMTMEEINEEIKAYRDAKNNHESSQKSLKSTNYTNLHECNYMII